MSITSRSEYGLRAMILLAEQLGDELLSAAEISRREHIPVKYLEQLLAELRKADLIVSHAGAKGGYRLARSARSITVGEVVHVLDGPMAPMSCVEEPPTFDCARELRCRLRPLWHTLRVAVSEILDGTTLDQLAYQPSLLSAPSARGQEPVDPSPKQGRMYHI